MSLNLFALSFLSFLLTLTLYEIISLAILSPRACKFTKMAGRIVIITLRALSCIISVVATGYIIRMLAETNSIPLDDIIGYSIFLAVIFIASSHLYNSIYNFNAYSFMIITQKSPKINKKCDPPLSPYFLRLRPSIKMELNLPKLKNIDTSKLTEMNLDQLKKLGLGNASPYELQSMANMDKKELLTELASSKGYDVNQGKLNSSAAQKLKSTGVGQNTNIKGTSLQMKKN